MWCLFYCIRRIGVGWMENYCILGNFNVGKIFLFNVLIGLYEYIGNWSGVMVEKKVGKLKENVG